MPRFDVYRGFAGAEYLLDCQSDLLADLPTRLVVPLRPKALAPPPIRRLNPVLVVNGEACVMITQQAAAIARRDCGPVVERMAHEEVAIINALDMLISGY
jgi:toxin CcdB